MEETRNFPADFLFGVATAATQIEGGDRNNNWFQWCEWGKPHQGDHCITANDHWNRVGEDIALMKQLNLQTYRLGLEWSRIEPQPGQFDPEAIAHYRDEIQQLVTAGIRPLVTLHHFSNPLWLEEQGAWTNPQAVDHFLHYVEYAVRALSDLVEDWITINEPNVYLAMGYIEGIFPPGKKGDMRSYFRAARHMVLGHLQAYTLIHRLRAERGLAPTRVGVAHHLRIFEPFKNRWLARQSSKLYHHFFQDIFLEGMTRGRLRWPLGSGYPFGEKVFADFMGINYYSRDIIKGRLNPLTLFGQRTLLPEAPTNDLGWEIYPEGLYALCHSMFKQYGLPIFITENGVCDAADALRPAFIYDHLDQLLRAIAEQIPVQRYYHWTLMDNFEWMEGYSARFGLIHCDTHTQQRTIRPSGNYYGRICRDRVLFKL